MTDAQFGLLTTVFLLVYGILSPFGGYFADRYSRKMVIILSLFVWSAVTAWTGFVSSYTEMLIARSVMGISEACYIPAAVAMVMDYHKGPTRSLASGILMSGLYVGMALGGTGGYIAEYWGWRVGFRLFGIIGIAYAVFLFFILKDHPKTSRMIVETNENARINLFEIIHNLFRSGSYRIIILYGALLGMTFWFIYAWLPTYFKEGFHLSLGQAGVSATAFIQIASLIGVITGGILADRRARKNVKGRIWITAVGFMVGGPFLFLMTLTEMFGIAVAGIIIFGLAKGFHDANFMPIICQVVDKRYQATGYGLMSFFSVIVGGLMIYVGGALKDANISISVVFQISAIGVFIAGMILLAIHPKRDGLTNDDEYETLLLSLPKDDKSEFIPCQSENGLKKN